MHRHKPRSAIPVEQAKSSQVRKIPRTERPNVPNVGITRGTVEACCSTFMTCIYILGTLVHGSLWCMVNCLIVVEFHEVAQQAPERTNVR